MILDQNFWVYYVLNFLKIVAGILNNELVTLWLIEVISINFFIHLGAKSSLLVIRQDERQSQLGAILICIFVCFIANKVSCNIWTVLLIENKIVPELVYINLWGTINKKCKDPLQVELSLVEVWLIYTNFMKVKRIDFCNFGAKPWESFFCVQYLRLELGGICVNDSVVIPDDLLDVIQLRGICRLFCVWNFNQRHQKFFAQLNIDCKTFIPSNLLVFTEDLVGEHRRKEFLRVAELKVDGFSGVDYKGTNTLSLELELLGSLIVARRDLINGSFHF